MGSLIAAVGALTSLEIPLEARLAIGRLRDVYSRADEIRRTGKQCDVDEIFEDDSSIRSIAMEADELALLRVCYSEPDEVQKFMLTHLKRSVTAAIARYLPEGIDLAQFLPEGFNLAEPLPEGITLAQLGSLMRNNNIIRRIGLQVDDSKQDERLVTLNRPEGLSFRALYEALNVVPDRKQLGVSPGNVLMRGPQQDGGPFGRQSFTIHFWAGNLPWSKQVQYLAERGQVPADPFLVTLAAATALVTGRGSILDDHCIRTADTLSKYGHHINMVDDRIGTGPVGVSAYFNHDLEYSPRVFLIAGSPNRSLVTQ